MIRANLQRERRGIDRLQRSINVRFPKNLNKYAVNKKTNDGLDNEKAGWSMTINSMIQKCNNGEDIADLLDERMFRKLVGVQKGEIRTIYLSTENIDFIMDAKEMIETKYRPYRSYPWAWIIIAMLTYAADMTLDNLVDMEKVKLPPIFIPTIAIR